MFRLKISDSLAYSISPNHLRITTAWGKPMYIISGACSLHCFTYMNPEFVTQVQSGVSRYVLTWVPDGFDTGVRREGFIWSFWTLEGSDILLYEADIGLWSRLKKDGTR